MNTVLPPWKMNNKTLSRVYHSNFRIRYNALRTASSSYISKKEVRDIIFNKSNHTCQGCGSKNDLTIDHIQSVYNLAKNYGDIEILNSIENLTTLCRICNSTKTP